MDITLIAIATLLIIAIVFLLLFLYKSINKKTFIADDGSVFNNQSELEDYQILYKKLKPLFDDFQENSSSKSILGFDKLFLMKLRTDGFQDLKTLVKFRDQLKTLSDLINT